MDWPEWWSWELELTPHLLQADGRSPLQRGGPPPHARRRHGFHENHEEGRFVVETTHDGRRWVVIVEPSPSDEALIVVTAYPLD